MGEAPGLVVRCQLCGSPELTGLLDLGDQPLAERMTADAPVFPLTLQQCGNCSLVQLGYIPDPDEVFPPDHPYTTGSTRRLADHFAELGRAVAAELEPGDVVIDIGANDGTLLSCMPHYVRGVAVEPTDQAEKCRKHFRTWQQRFTPACAADIERVMGCKAKLITATNVMAHVPDPHEVAEGVRRLLAPDGVFVAENHDVTRITDGLQIDTIYHEHARYWSPATFALLCEMHGMDVAGHTWHGTHGGSFRTTARLRRTDLGQRTRAAMMQLNGLMRRAVRQGEVFGVGATTRGSTLIHSASLQNMITCVCEVTGSEKIGKVMPGTAIPVVDEKQLTEQQPAFALLFAWHLRDYLIPALTDAGYQGRFIIPLPVPMVVPGVTRG